ncbi:putative reverse transcriptase domain-containing protein [Tanacetum coccineum]
MCTYLKNMEGYKLKDLKLKEFDSIQEMFDRAFKKVNIFEDFRTELVEGKEKRVGTELIHEITKKQKVEDDKETTELKQLMEIIPDEKEVEIDGIPLAVKSPSIVGWKIYKEGRKSYYQIMRADGKSQMYMIFSQMLKSFNKEDLEDLYKLVKAEYESTRPVEDLDLMLWGDLKTMFEPHLEDKSTFLDDATCANLYVEKKYPLAPLTLSMMKCNKVRHRAKDCINLVAATATQRALVVNQRVPTCFECGRQGHYRNECPKLKNQTCGNKARKNTNEARGKAYVLGGGEAKPNSNVVTGTFLLNNHYASLLFDSGADRSFVLSTFSALLDVIPSTLDVSYDVELADKRVTETNTVLRGCTLGLLGHPFNIGLIPIELGSFDVIIGMDWLANHHAVIICDGKIVWIPYGDEVLIVQGDRSGKEKKSKLSIISCTKTQKYIKKGCQIFLAQVTKEGNRRQVRGEAT